MLMEERIGENRQPVASGGEARRREAFVSRLTAEGRGAIAVLRVWGPGALEVANAVFRPHRSASLAKTRRGQLRLGRIGHGKGDEVVVDVATARRCWGGAQQHERGASEAIGVAERSRGSSRFERDAAATLVAAEVERVGTRQQQVAAHGRVGTVGELQGAERAVRSVILAYLCASGGAFRFRPRVDAGR